MQIWAALIADEWQGAAVNEIRPGPADVRQYANWPMNFYNSLASGWRCNCSIYGRSDAAAALKGDEPAATDLYIDLVIDYCTHLHIGRATASFLDCGLFGKNERAVCA
jgi:hypothetical protein